MSPLLATTDPWLELWTHAIDYSLILSVCVRDGCCAERTAAEMKLLVFFFKPSSQTPWLYIYGSLFRLYLFRPVLLISTRLKNVSSSILASSDPTPVVWLVTRWWGRERLLIWVMGALDTSSRPHHG
jgi:hypothetical protein